MHLLSDIDQQRFNTICWTQKSDHLPTISLYYALIYTIRDCDFRAQHIWHRGIQAGQMRRHMVLHKRCVHYDLSTNIESA